MDMAILNAAQPNCSDTATSESLPPTSINMEAGETAGQGPLQAVVATPSTTALEPAMRAAPAAPAAPLPPSARAELSPGLTWPPGYAGVIAKYIFDGAPRPVAEVAIVGALGLLAGICGRRWSTHTDAGLNAYVILVARSAIGKEAMHDGVARLIKMATQTPALALGVKFVDYSDFASGPALQKAVASNPCFVNVTGEFGHKLNMIANAKQPDSPAMSLRRSMTNLYSKSGPDGITGGIKYSDASKSVESIVGVAYSMIGETTPGTFFELLTPAMMADGFMSRFSVVEYQGSRPDENRRAREFKTLNPESLLGLQNLIGHALTPSLNQLPTQVQCSCEAIDLLEEFSYQCDANIEDAGDNESVRQMWNRAHLKVLKFAALLAVADAGPTGSPHATVNYDHAAWAIDFVLRDIETFRTRLESGDVGTDDDARESKLLSLAIKFLSTKPGELPISFQKFEHLRKAAIIPRKYLQQLTSQLPAFRNHRLGSTKALNEALESLVKTGHFQAIFKEHAHEQYGFFGECYRCLQP